MKKIKAKIISNRHIAGKYYKISIASPYLGKNTKPGQFFEVKCSEVSAKVLLRRPLGAHRILKSGVEILYEAIGKGTEALSGRKTGELLDVIGPLGSGFNLEHKGTRAQGHKLIVAGGIGVAPLVALAEEIRKKGDEVEVLIGARTGAHILCEKELRKLGCHVKVSTDDGSKGKKGLVTACLGSLLSTIDHRPSTIYACGPSPMLKAVAQLAETYNIPCQVSLEERMACGVGVCLGCPVKVRAQYARRTTQYEYKMVCKDGPVFDSKEIIWK